MLLEHAECVGIEHLCPLVAVVSGSVASRHDVAELHRHARVGQLLCYHGFLPCLLFKGYEVAGKRLFHGVVGHVEQSEAHLPHATVGSHEVAAPDYACYQFVRDGFARLVVESKRAQELLFHGIILHKLRRQFHKVPQHVGTAEAFKARVGKHSVERVAELVQERLHLAERKQRRLVLRRLCKVHHNAHVRTHILAVAVNPLPLILRHPCASLLALARMEVGIEHGKV